MGTPGFTTVRAPRSGGRPRVLVVEDDEDTRELIALALGGEGFAIETSRGSEEALRLLRARAYDLLITDYDMPGRTGAELVKEAARAGLLDPRDALIVTAHPEPVGVDGLSLVRKPVDLGRLVAILRGILTRQAGVPSPASAAPDPVVELDHGALPDASAGDDQRGARPIVMPPAGAGRRTRDGRSADALSYLLARDDSEA